MFTLFDFLKLLGAVAGTAAVGIYGYRTFGWLGAVIGLPLGFLVGSFVCSLPWVVSSVWMRRDLKRCDTTKLKDRLQSEYFISHLLIAELVARGEPLEQFREHVVALLRSDQPAQKHFGERTARIWFPELLPTSEHPSSTSTPLANDKTRNS